MTRLKTPWLIGLATAGVVALAMVFYWRVWGDVPTLVRALDHCDDLFCDFTRQYYPTGQALFDTGKPSNGYFYTSFFALFLAPLGQMDLETAVSLWSLFQAASLLLLLLPAVYFYRQRPWLVVAYVALVVLTMPVLHNLKWGQVSLFITGLIYASFFAYRREHKTAAALILGVATAVKYYAILFALYYLLRREWRLLLALGLSIVFFVVIIPVLALGWETNWQFYQTVSERITHARTGWILRDPNSQYLANVVNRLAENIWQTTTSRLLWQLVGFATAGVGTAAAIWVVWQQQTDADLWFLSMIFLVLPFIVETTWPHYFVYLPFVQVFLLWQLWQHSRRGLWLGGGLILLSVVPMTMLYFAWLNDRGFYARYGTLFWVNLVVFVVAFGMLLGAAWRHFRQQGYRLLPDRSLVRER